MIRFGTSGNPPNFFKSKYGKDRKNAVDWINSIGLNAYELLMTYGARTKVETAEYVGKRAKELDVEISVHGPYYVVLTSDREKVVSRSINELVKTLKLADILGAKKVVLHPGFYNGNAIDRFVSGMKKVMNEYYGDAIVLPETMGKKSQLGSVKEILEICERTESVPCIDFGHVHARENGSLKTTQDFRNVIEQIEKVLGREAVKKLHCHFYPVEFTDKGERKHRAVTEKNVFPQFKHFAPVIKEFKMNPTLISESKDSQDIGALQMKRIMQR